MEDSSWPIHDALENIRRLYRSTSKLLNTSYQTFKDLGQGWKHKGDLVALPAQSKSLKMPGRWLPSFAYIALMTDEEKLNRIRVHVSVIFDSAPGDGDLHQSIVSCGYYRFKQRAFDVKLEGVSERSLKVHLFTGDTDYSGRFIAVEESLFGKDLPESARFDKAETMALPLLSVRNPSQLKERVTDPLISRLKSLTEVS